MPRVPTPLLPVLAAAALWPMQAGAQEGPSFDCRYAQTATEAAICANPDLARLEMRMYGSYLGLVEAMGERSARRIADRFLERRQACGANEACIAERLLITMQVFEQRAGGTTSLAALVPAEEEPAPPPSAPAATPLAAVVLPPPRPEGLTAEPAPVIEEDLAVLDPLPAPPIEDLDEPPAFEEDLAAPAPVIEEDLAALEPPPAPPIEDLGELPAIEEDLAAPAPMIEEDLAALDPLSAPPIEEPVEPPAIEEEAAVPDLPLAAQAPLPPDLDPLLEAPDAALDEVPPEASDLAAAEPPPSSEEIGQTLEGAELASSDEAASFDTPISWAFMDLSREERADLQIRLQAAGFHDGPVEGTWDRATQEALDAFLASEEGTGFDPATEPGAALILDFIRSDSFVEASAAEPAAAEPAADDPLASTEW